MQFCKLTIAAIAVCFVQGTSVADQLPQNALPDAVVSLGKNNLKKAWLARPTTRYGHDILGDAIEAGSMVTVTSCGHEMEYVLDESLVFEDRQARIVDLDGDHYDEIVVVESSLTHGAALSVYGPKGATCSKAGGLKRIARTPFIGTRNRWLNPAGIADYDGDGTKEIAIVVTPHIGGTLQFWSLRKGEFVLKAEKFGYSIHAIGSRQQELSATVDDVLFLPDANRRTLMRVMLKGGTIDSTPVGKLPSKVTGPVTAQKGTGGEVLLSVPTASDGVVELKSRL